MIPQITASLIPLCDLPLIPPYELPIIPFCDMVEDNQTVGDLTLTGEGDLTLTGVDDCGNLTLTGEGDSGDGDSCEVVLGLWRKNVTTLTLKIIELSKSNDINHRAQAIFLIISFIGIGDEFRDPFNMVEREKHLFASQKLFAILISPVVAGWLPYLKILDVSLYIENLYEMSLFSSKYNNFLQTPTIKFLISDVIKTYNAK